MKIAHIINPVKVNENSDLFYAQPITFESMLQAKAYCQISKNVQLFTIQYEEDREIILKGFIVLPNLTRSVLDINSNLKKRKLPLIKDILSALATNTDADYYIYTNADIGLLPNFYDKIIEEINNGFDAIIINRRRIKAKYFEVSDLENIYKDKGKSHPGFDCFVFHKSLLQKFVLDEICVGIPFLGVSLAYNIFTFAKKPLYIPDKYLTFHIGTDVLPKRNNEFYIHNFNSFFFKIKPNLKPFFKLEKFPYAGKYLLIQALKWFLNPSLNFRDFLEMKFPVFFKEKNYTAKIRYNKEDKLYKIKSFINEIRWFLLQR